METRNKRILLITAIVILAGVLLYIQYKQRTPPVVESPAEEGLGLVATSSTLNVNDIKIEGTGNAIVSIERTPGAELPKPIPNLDVAFVFDPSISQKVKDILTVNIKELNDKLKKDPSVYENWIDLGLQWKIAGNYELTRDYWEYASKLHPRGSLSFVNLGDLYAYYLKDTVLAEERLLTALRNAPAEIGVYLRLIDLYKDFTGDKAKALAIVNRGLERFPGDPNLVKYKTELSK